MYLWIILAHFIGDWIQPLALTRKRGLSDWWLAPHALWAAVPYLVFGWQVAILIGGAHLAIDYYRLGGWLTLRLGDWDQTDPPLPSWCTRMTLILIIDQTLHVAVNALIVWMLWS